MKSNIFPSSIILFYLLLFSINLSYGRKEPAAGDYWKSIMKDKPMPKALKDLFHEDDEMKTDHFARDFVLKSSAIIYHRNPEAKIDEKNKQLQKEKSINPAQQKVPAKIDEKNKQLQKEKSIHPEQQNVPAYTQQEMKDKLHKINNKTP